MEASKPKWVNSDYIQYGVNSLSLGGLYIRTQYILVKIFYLNGVSYRFNF